MFSIILKYFREINHCKYTFGSTGKFKINKYLTGSLIWGRIFYCVFKKEKTRPWPNTFDCK